MIVDTHFHTTYRYHLSLKILGKRPRLTSDVLCRELELLDDIYMRAFLTNGSALMTYI